MPQTTAISRHRHDVVVVGARAAGAATALLLARLGHDVVLLDRAVFPADTISTHQIARTGVVAAAPLGAARGGPGQRGTGDPPGHLHRSGRVDRPERSSESPAWTCSSRPAATSSTRWLPRRRLTRAWMCGLASRYGVRRDDAGRVIGVYGRDARRRSGRDRGPVRRRRGRIGVAGGPLGRRRGHRAPRRRRRGPIRLLRRPAVARHRADRRRPCPGRGVPHPPRPGLHLDLRPRRRTRVAPAAAPRPARRRSPRCSTGPRRSWRERLRAGRRTSPVTGMLRSPNLLRRAHGPGWALVGDAGYHRDPITGHGLSDAYRDAELLADALHRALRGETRRGRRPGRLPARARPGLT